MNALNQSTIGLEAPSNNRILCGTKEDSIIYLQFRLPTQDLQTDDKPTLQQVETKDSKHQVPSELSPSEEGESKPNSLSSITQGIERPKYIENSPVSVASILDEVGIVVCQEPSESTRGSIFEHPGKDDSQRSRTSLRRSNSWSGRENRILDDIVENERNSKFNPSKPESAFSLRPKQYRDLSASEHVTTYGSIASMSSKNWITRSCKDLFGMKKTPKIPFLPNPNAKALKTPQESNGDRNQEFDIRRNFKKNQALSMSEHLPRISCRRNVSQGDLSSAILKERLPRVSSSGNSFLPAGSSQQPGRIRKRRDAGRLDLLSQSEHIPSSSKTSESSSEFGSDDSSWGGLTLSPQSPTSSKTKKKLPTKAVSTGKLSELKTLAPTEQARKERSKKKLQRHRRTRDDGERRDSKSASCGKRILDICRQEIMPHKSGHVESKRNGQDSCDKASLRRSVSQLDAATERHRSSRQTSQTRRQRMSSWGESAQKPLRMSRPSSLCDLRSQKRSSSSRPRRMLSSQRKEEMTSSSHPPRDPRRMRSRTNSTSDSSEDKPSSWKEDRTGKSTDASSRRHRSRSQRRRRLSGSTGSVRT